MADLLTPDREKLIPVIRQENSLPPSAPNPVQSYGYSAALSPDQQTNTDVIGQVYRGTSIVRHSPLPAQAIATVNAAANSAAEVIVKNNPAAPPVSSVAGVSSVGLAMPPQFIVSGSPVTSAGTLTAAWTPELPSTFLRAPAPGLSSFQSVAQAGGFQAGSGGTTLLISDTPTTATSLGFIVAGSNSTLSTPSGWSAVPGSGIHSAAWYKAISGTSPVSVSESLTGTDINWAASFSLFTGPAPTFVQANNATTKSGTLAFSSNNTAGNTLFVVMQYLSSAAGTNYSPIFGDSQNNVYTRIANTGVPFVPGSSTSQVAQQVFVAPNCAGGANTITYNFGGKTLGIPNFTIFIIEFGPLPTGAGIPLFGFISSADVPPVNLANSGNGGVGGILGVINGGTGSDLSATGGTSQFLLQSTSGGVVTPLQPDFSDLAGAAGKLATRYNGVALVSNGLPVEYAKIDLTAQAANVGPSTLYAVPASGVGMYRISSYIVMTTAASVNSTLPTVQLVYTDNDSGVSITMDATPISGTAGLGQTGALTANTVGTSASGVIAVNVKASTTIQYQTVNYSSTAAGMQYAVHIKLEAL